MELRDKIIIWNLIGFGLIGWSVMSYIFICGIYNLSTTGNPNFTVRFNDYNEFMFEFFFVMINTCLYIIFMIYLWRRLL